MTTTHLKVNPDALGYVVRYENYGPGKPSRPLWFTDCFRDNTPVLVIPDETELATLFQSWADAYDAILKSIAYQIEGKLDWNQMYGDYLIEPVVIE